MKETPTSKNFSYKSVGICSSPVLLQRSVSLRQKKKILPGDKISVEKNFPKFYEKCQIKKQRSVTCSKSNPLSGTVKKSTCSNNNTLKQNVMKGNGGDSYEAAELQALGDQIQSLKIEKNSLLSVKSRSQKADTTPKVVYAHKKSPVSCKRSRYQLTEEFAEEFQKQQKRKQENAFSADRKLNLVCCSCQDKQLKVCCCEENQQINNHCEQKQQFDSQNENCKESLVVPTTKVGAVQSSFKPKGLKDKTKDGKDDKRRHLVDKGERKTRNERKAEERFNQVCETEMKEIKKTDFEKSDKGMRQKKCINENGEYLNNVSESKNNDREQQNISCRSKMTGEQPVKENSKDDKAEVFIEGSIQQPNEVQESGKVITITRKVSQQALLRRISEEEEQKEDTGIGNTLELRRRKKLECPKSLPLATTSTIDKYALWKKLSEEMKNREIANGCSSITDKSELDKLKLVAQKLHLNTRRPSYVEWLTKLNQGKIFDGNSELKAEIVGQKEQTEDERRENLKNALKWLRNELLEMNRTDQRLARQLMQLRIEIQTLRLQMSCSEHQAMVEEVTSEVEDLKDQDMPLCDFPMGHRGSRSPLRDIGITRMNITNRRFSLS